MYADITPTNVSMELSGFLKSLSFKQNVNIIRVEKHAAGGGNHCCFAHILTQLMVNS